jgi:hypothetical protein
MRFLFLMALGTALGCDPTLGAVPEAPPDSESGPTELVVQTVELRNEVDALRCFLLHEKELKEGKVLIKWAQPSLEQYETATIHPCDLLPDFKDPQEEARVALEHQQQALLPPEEPPALAAPPE